MSTSSTTYEQLILLYVWSTVLLYVSSTMQAAPADGVVREEVYALLQALYRAQVALSTYIAACCLRMPLHTHAHTHTHTGKR